MHSTREFKIANTFVVLQTQHLFSYNFALLYSVCGGWVHTSICFAWSQTTCMLKVRINYLQLKIVSGTPTMSDLAIWFTLYRFICVDERASGATRQEISTATLLEMLSIACRSHYADYHDVHASLVVWNCIAKWVAIYCPVSELYFYMRFRQSLWILSHFYFGIF